MELRDLEYFLSCSEHGSLTRAARSIHVSQPTLSHALARLEQESGESLLHRPANKRSPLSLTPAGHALRQRALRIQEELQGFHQDLDEIRGLVRGHVHICGIQSLNMTLLPGVLAPFVAEYPNLEVRLSTRPSDEIANTVRCGHDEIGVCATAPEHSQSQETNTLSSNGLREELLYVEDFVAIIRHDDPLASQQSISMKDLKERDLLLMNPESSTGASIRQACQQAGFTPHPRLSLESGEALRETVRAGLGISILPRGYLTEADPDLRAINLIEPTPWRQVLVIRSQDRKLSRAADAFLTTLRTWVTLKK